MGLPFVLTDQSLLAGAEAGAGAGADPHLIGSVEELDLPGTERGNLEDHRDKTFDKGALPVQQLKTWKILILEITSIDKNKKCENQPLLGRADKKICQIGLVCMQRFILD